MFRNILLSLTALAVPASLLAQIPAGAQSPVPATLDGFYQVNYASNLNRGDAVVNVTNTGASAGTNVPVVNGNSYGDICVNAYVYSPDQEPATCCVCRVTPNELDSWPVYFGSASFLNGLNNVGSIGARNQIINGNYSVVIKLYATVAPGIGGTANYPSSSCPRPDSPGSAANGLVAWATHSHPTNVGGVVAITETPFVNSYLSPGELGKLTGDCHYTLTQGSGFVCPFCLKSTGLLAPGL